MWQLRLPRRWALRDSAPGPRLFVQRPSPARSAPTTVVAAVRRRSSSSGGSGSRKGGGRAGGRQRDAAAVEGMGQAVRQARQPGGGGRDGGTMQQLLSVEGSVLSSDTEQEDAWEPPAELDDTEAAELLGQDVSGPDALAGADEGVEARLAWALGHFPFSLDPFQVKALRHLLAGRSVVVCAPTGAGKTAIAEAAALHYLDQGQRVIYTTPLKALSNQKLQELRGRFGTDGVGLQTGDASINIEAPVVVMTTEILRNVLYRVDDDGSTAADRMQGVALVVLDEVHYLGDPGRGSVWEEVIINLPPHVQLLCMSATVRNPEDLGGWISQVHAECDTVTTTFRPVPLTWHYGFGHDGEARLLPLLDARQRGLNPALIPPAKRYGGDESDEDWGRLDARGGGRGRGSKRGGIRLRTLEELVGSQEGEEFDDAWHKEPRWKRIPSLETASAALRVRGMLPAIWFIFSRRDCDMSAQQFDTRDVTLTTPEEQEAIRQEVKALLQEQPEAVKKGAVPALLRGAAAHHAGCLPAWKALIERLFQRGLLKLVFATETLAAGINMPARTTIVSALSRRRDGGVAALQHNELLQMAGRAGRRGFDTLGHCVILQSKWEDPDAAWAIIKKGPEALRSQFSTGYGMVLNLLFTRSMADARAFLDRSFSRYLGGAGHQRRLREIADLEARAQALLDEVAQRSSGDGGSIGEEKGAAMWAKYQKGIGRLREEKRAAKVLRAQLAEERGFVADTVLAKLGMPRLVGLDLSASNMEDSSYRLPAVALRRLDGSGSSGWAGEPGRYLCLGADNTLYKVDARHVSGVAEEAAFAEDPEGAARAALRCTDDLRRSSWKELAGGVECAPGSALTALVAARLPPADVLTPVVPGEAGRAALAEQRRRIKEVKWEVDEIKSDRQFMKAAKKFSKQTSEAHALLDRAVALREVMEQQIGGSWKAFEDLTAILQETGAFTLNGEEEVTFSALGQVAREVSGANELWLALVLTHPALQSLQPHQLAGVLSAVVAPESVSRTTLWTAYPATEVVVETVEALDGAREALLGLQIRAGVDIPVAMDLRMAGVVEAWASNCSWPEVMSDCNLDDGDMARLLTRTTDLMKQVARCEYLLPAMRRSARAAAKAMDRPPISDLVT